MTASLVIVIVLVFNDVGVGVFIELSDWSDPVCGCVH